MYLKTIPHLLTKQECQDFIQWGEAGLYESTGADYPAGYRNNDRLVADRPDLAQRMMKRLRDFLPKQHTWGGVTWTLEELNPRFRGCRYRNGQSFTRHRDGAHSPDDSTRSFLTVMLYLNDHSEFDGGGTRFYQDRYVENSEREVMPEMGLAILFSHDYWHDGQPVTAGTKYVLRTDVMYRAEKPVLDGHRGYVWTVNNLNNGRLMSGSRDKSIKIWERDQGEYRVTQTLAQHSASVTCLSPSSRGFVSGSRDRSLIWWEDEGSVFRPVHRKAAHDGAVLCLQRQPSTDILSAGADGMLKRWSANGSPIGSCHIGGWAWCVETTPQEIVCGLESGELITVDFGMSDRKVVYRHSSPLTSLLRRADGSYLIGTGTGVVLILDSRFQLVTTLAAHRGAVTSLESVESSKFISGGEDDGVRLWQKVEGRWKSSFLTSHNDFVRSLCLTDRGEIVSASYDGTLRVIPYAGNSQSNKPSVIRRTARAAKPGGAISGTAAANW